MNRKNQAGFTLIELLVALAVFMIALLILSVTLEGVNRSLSGSRQRMDKVQISRMSLELMARELSQVVVDTRMQFVTGPGQLLVSGAGVENVSENAPFIVGMAPLGRRNHLYTVGYFLSRDEVNKAYRLKRIFIPPRLPRNQTVIHPAYPKMVSPAGRLDRLNQLSSTQPSWFFQNWDAECFDETNLDNGKLITSTVAEGVIAMWVQCYDPMGNPIPRVSESSRHPASPLWYNSAAHFYQASGAPFDDGSSFVYLSSSERFAMKAHLLPASIEILLYIVDPIVIEQAESIPEMISVNEDGKLNLEASTANYEELLRVAGISGAKSSSIRFKLINGK